MNAAIIAAVLVLLVAAVPSSPATSGQSTSGSAASGWAPAHALVAAPASSSCVVRARREARYRGVGYDHIVQLDSGCSFAVSCLVTTNVNPKAQRVQLRAGGHTELLTYRGSPSRTFRASVSCQRAG